jgi:hypothetical protein
MRAEVPMACVWRELGSKQSVCDSSDLQYDAVASRYLLYLVSADWAESSAWSTEQHMIDLASSGDYQMGAHVGDISYSTGAGSKWFLFDERMSLLGRQLPTLVGHGNHERDMPNTGASAAYWNITDSGGEAGIPVSTRYPMPWCVCDSLADIHHVPRFGKFDGRSLRQGVHPGATGALSANSSTP